MEVCDKVHFSCWVVDDKVFLQLRDVINGLGLCCAVHIFTFLGTLHAGKSENHYVVSMVANGHSDVRAFDMYGGLKLSREGIEDSPAHARVRGSRQGKLSQMHQVDFWDPVFQRRS